MMLINSRLRVTGGMELRNPLEDMERMHIPASRTGRCLVRLAGEVVKKERRGSTDRDKVPRPAPCGGGDRR